MATYITIETDKKIAYQIDGGEKNVMFANVEDDGYPEPTGTITITQNGTGIDVKDYAEADVNVPGGGYPEPTGTITITQNGTGINVKDYADADVNVPTYPEPTGTITITQNGTGIDVKDYALANVNVIPTNIISGTFIGSGTTDVSLNIGFEPDVVLIKSNLDFSTAGWAGIGMLVIWRLTLINSYRHTSTTATNITSTINSSMSEAEPYGSSDTASQYNTYATYSNGTFNITNKSPGIGVNFVTGVTYTWYAVKF